MKAYLLTTCLLVVGLSACREAELLPHPLSDIDFGVASLDAGPIPDGAVGSACPCTHPDLIEVGDPCTCRERCVITDPIPRCSGWQTCAQLGYGLPDGGREQIDAFACIQAGAPDSVCSPAPCAEVLVCARLSNSDAGNTCRYTCDPNADAGVEDASGIDGSIPATGDCPAGQLCHRMQNNNGACFYP